MKMRSIFSNDSGGEDSGFGIQERSSWHALIAVGPACASHADREDGENHGAPLVDCLNPEPRTLSSYHFHIKRPADEPVAAAFANSLIVSGKVCRIPAFWA